MKTGSSLSTSILMGTAPAEHREQLMGNVCANAACRVMHCMRAEIREMNEKGSIINASSIAGIQGFPKNGAYTAAKVRKSTKTSKPY